MQPPPFNSARLTAACIACVLVTFALAGCGGGPEVRPSAPSARNGSRAVRAQCDELARATRARIAPLRRRASSLDFAALGKIGRCLPAGRGAWVLEWSELSVSKEPRYMEEGSSWEAQGAWSLAFVDGAGHVQRARSIGGEVYRTDPSEQHVAVLVVHDYDGDGAAQIVLRTEGSNFEGGDGREAAGFYTFRGGAIAPYAPGARLAADLGAVVDADRDGRPDFTLPGPCAMSVACGEEAYPPRERGPMFLAHALASGGFSTDDAVAKRFVERQCVQPNGAERMVLTRAHDDAVSAVACDRIFGITEAEVIADLREVNAEQELCPALDALIDLARTEPPFVLEK